MFDALGYIKKLESLGVSREVAELQVKMHMDIYNSEIVTPKDMNLLSSHFYQEAEKLKAEFEKLRTEFESFKSEMRIEFAQFREEMRSDIAAFKDEMRKEMTAFKEELRNEMAQLRNDIINLQHEVKNMENRITIKLGIMMTAVMGIFAILIK